MKRLMLAIATCLVCVASANGGGLYILSGGDLRLSQIRYVLQTTESSQEIEVTPQGVLTLAVYDKDVGGPWSVKHGSTEFRYARNDTLRMTSGGGFRSDMSTGVGGTVGTKGCTNAAPGSMVFSQPGQHYVKLYSSGCNVMKVWFANNPNIVGARVDHRDWSDSGVGKTPSCQFTKCGNLKSVWYGNSPNFGTTPEIHYCTNMQSIVFSNPEDIRTVSSAFLALCTNIVQVQTFPNATNYLANAFQNCISLEYCDLSGAVSIGDTCLSMSSFQTGSKHGPLKIRIGDVVRKIGKNVAYACLSLQEIEFLCDDDDWISNWNSNQVLTSWSGQLEQFGDDPDQARFVAGTIATKDGVYWTGNTLPHFDSIVVKRVRRTSN